MTTIFVFGAIVGAAFGMILMGILSGSEEPMNFEYKEDDRNDRSKTR